VRGEDLPLVEAEVLDATGEPLLDRRPLPQAPEDVAELGLLDVVEEADVGVVLLVVADGVQAQHRGLGGPGHRPEAHAQRLLALTVTCPVAAQHPNRPAGHPGGLLRVHAGSGPPELHEVGVGVEDDDAQVGVDEEPFEQHPEGVGLARSALPAEERVPVEAGGADQRGSSGAGEPAAHRRRGTGGLLERGEGRAVRGPQREPGEGGPGAAVQRPVGAEHPDDDALTVAGRGVVRARLDDLADHGVTVLESPGHHVPRSEGHRRRGGEPEGPTVAGVGGGSVAGVRHRGSFLRTPVTVRSAP
jgi:hypothetical protein